MRWLLFLVLTFGCGPSRRLNPCSPSANPVPASPVVVGLVGTPVEIDLQLPPAVFCPEGNPVATDVMTEVVDAQNQPVAHQHTEATSNDVTGYRTRISFTPATPGAYSLTARFEPALGVARRQLQAVLDRSGEAPALRVTLGAACDDVWPLGQVVLCRRGGEVAFIEDGGVTSTTPALGVLGAGDSAWVWSVDQVTRFTQGDGGLERLAHPVSPAGGALAVTSTRWLQGRETRFFELAVEDGGLVERSWSVEPDAGPISGPGLSRAGELVGWATTDQLCASAPDASVRCVDNALVPLVGEGDGLWLRSAETGVVALARLLPTGGKPALLFVPAQPSGLSEARQVRPVYNWDGRLVVVRADDLSFEAWRAPGAVLRQSVNEGWVVFQLQSGETVIYRR